MPVPGAPTALAGVANPDGTVGLTWAAPTAVFQDFVGTANTLLTAIGYGTDYPNWGPGCHLDGNGNAVMSLPDGIGGNIWGTPLGSLDMFSEITFNFATIVTSYCQVTVFVRQMDPSNGWANNPAQYHGYGLVLRTGSSNQATYPDRLQIQEDDVVRATVTAPTFTALAPGDHKLRLQASGSTLTGYLDGVSVITYTDPTPTGDQYCGFNISSTTGGSNPTGVLVRSHTAGLMPSDVTDYIVEYRLTPSAVVFSDNFDRADTANGGSAGPGLGSGWKDDGAWCISGNTALRAGGGSSDYAVFLSDTGSVDHWAECTMVTGPQNAQYIVLNARRPANNAQDAYMVFLPPDNSGLTIGKSVGGSYSDVHKTAYPLNQPIKLRIECQGSTIRAYAADVLIDTQTDTSIDGSTRGGTYCGINANGGTLDNFRCGPLPYTP